MALEEDFQVFTKDLSKHSVVVEVGGNCGEQTAGFSDRVGKVITFEGHPTYTWERFVGKWGKKENVTWIQKAVGKVVGRVTFHVSRGGAYDGGEYANSSSVRPPTEECARRWPVMKFSAIQVDGTTLDHELGGVERVDALWMDCQGGEMDVFLGGRQTLGKTNLVYVEGHMGQYEGAPTWEEIERVLWEAGINEQVWGNQERRIYRRPLLEKPIYQPGQAPAQEYNPGSQDKAHEPSEEWMVNRAL